MQYDFLNLALIYGMIYRKEIHQLILYVYVAGDIMPIENNCLIIVKGKDKTDSIES